MTYQVYKSGKFEGAFALSDALSHIGKDLTIAQAIAEGWEITTKPEEN
jgi:hypothetical protein